MKLTQDHKLQSFKPTPLRNQRFSGGSIKPEGSKTGAPEKKATVNSETNSWQDTKDTIVAVAGVVASLISETLFMFVAPFILLYRALQSKSKGDSKGDKPASKA